ncbi:MAG: bifunctional RNase H/acid phosphatase [Acidobacteria bacterium]|nr:bifunctional RNase H/acid phosphatase [Acidobacteriota bacterium]
MSAERHVLYCDGAARGNPGPAAIGGVLFAPGRVEPVVAISEAIGRATNNEAEYRALLAGLQAALEAGVTRLLVRLDSELLVNQMNGSYRVKAAGLKPLHAQVAALLGRFTSVVFEQVPRERNSIADELANAALDA